MSIAVSEFVKRQTPESEFSHFTGTWDELLTLVSQSFANGMTTPGYRDGVVLVNLQPTCWRDGDTPLNFFTNIVQLKEGDKLVGEYKSRQPGEEPRKSMRVVNGKKITAKSVFVVLYRADVLAEGNERSSDAEWEIISLNASPFHTDVEVPMPVGTLISNYFQLSGGTDTKMTPEQFRVALQKSVMFWKDKAFASG